MMVKAAGPAAASLADGFDRPRNVAEAAEQFEALMIGELLRPLHESGGWMGSQDAASEPLTGLAEQQLSMALASNGGLGLGRLIAEGLQGAADGRSQSVPK